MNNKHTAGEWIMENPDNRESNFVIYTTENPEGIANVYPGEKAEANAKIIAAAPDMLSVLKEAVDHSHVYDTNPALIELFTAVINKATI